MKYEIVEFVLNEYVDHPTEGHLGFVEAKSRQEALAIAKQWHPNNPSVTVKDIHNENFQ